MTLKAFKLKIEPLAKLDIQKEIKYYNRKQPGLGKKFHIEIKRYFKAISQNPFYAIRYDKVHCLPLKIFPAMIHFSIDERSKIVVVRAVINTNKNPKVYYLK